MAARSFKVLVEWDAKSEVWVTYVPTLNQLSTFGHTREEALEHTREAVRGYLEAESKEGIAVASGESEMKLTDVAILARGFAGR